MKGGGEENCIQNVKKKGNWMKEMLSEASAFYEGTGQTYVAYICSLSFIGITII